MTKPVVVHANPARVVQDVLRAALTARGDRTPLSRGLPSAWTPRAGPHVIVQWDGTPTATPPVVYGASVRVTVYAEDPNRAEDIATLAQGLLLAYPGDADLARVRYLAGVLPGRDPENRAALATFTVRADMRGRSL